LVSQTLPPNPVQENRKIPRYADGRASTFSRMGIGGPIGHERKKNGAVQVRLLS